MLAKGKGNIFFIFFSIIADFLEAILEIIRKMLIYKRNIASNQPVSNNIYP